MAPPSKEIAVDMSPFFRIYTDGSIDRLNPSPFHPTSDDANSTVRSKDVVIDSETGVSVRIFVPGSCDPAKKLPLVIYTHGGAFCFGSPTGTVYHNYVAELVEKSNVVAVSIDYRLAPEHPLPAAYDDSFAAFRWVVSHALGQGPEPWLNQFPDFQRLFVGGDSAGATIANDIAVRAGLSHFDGVEVKGIFLIHPYFGDKVEDKLYKIFYPTSTARDDDVQLNPAANPRIREMAGRRVLFLLAENDFLVKRGKAYCDRLRKSEWSGEVETMESSGVGHCFHLHDTKNDKALAMMDKLVLFLNDTS